jgi:hypothetical protein
MSTHIYYHIKSDPMCAKHCLISNTLLLLTAVHLWTSVLVGVLAILVYALIHVYGLVSNIV